MAQIVTTIPQNLDPFKHISLQELIAFLPDTIPYTQMIGVSGKICGGKQIGNLCFEAAQDEETSTELKQYFASLVEQGTNGDFTATVDNKWRMPIKIFWLYADGQKMVNSDLVYTRLPPPVTMPLELTKDYVLSRLPAAIPFTETLWATGGIVREGRSAKDFDVIAGEVSEDENGQAVITQRVESARLLQIKEHLEAAVKATVSATSPFRIDVGSTIMANKGEVYLCKIYENGQFCYTEE